MDTIRESILDLAVADGVLTEEQATQIRDGEGRRPGGPDGRNAPGGQDRPGGQGRPGGQNPPGGQDAPSI